MAFARALQENIGASRVLLFGSHARDSAQLDSDVDIIVVSEAFRDVPPARRAIGLRAIWYEAGGNAPMDLICLTSDEFEQASRGITLIAAVLPEAIDLLPIAA